MSHQTIYIPDDEDAIDPVLPTSVVLPVEVLQLDEIKPKDVTASSNIQVGALAPFSLPS